jgi:chaperonin GroEL
MSAHPKEIIFAEDALRALKEGIDEVADAVAMTLGPRGRNVGLQGSFGSPTITSDGDTIAKEIDLKDPYKNMGASMAKETAAKIKEKSGDGTTTGILLLRALVREGAKNIASGANPVAIKRGMDKTLEALLKEIDRMAVQIQDGKDTRNIATVSASSSREIGDKIGECFDKVGKTGIVAIEEGKKTETVIEIVDGMQFTRGYASPYFCTNAEKMIAEMSHPNILITDKKISSAQEILPILQHVAAAGQELFIIAEDIDGDALSTLVINKLRGSLKIAAAKAPGFGDRRKAMMEDIAILTGASLVSEEKGMNLRDAEADVLGRAEQVIVGKDTTTIIGGSGNADDLKARIAQIDNEIKKASSKYDREYLEDRKAKLQGGVALIKVGGYTDSEMKKNKQLYEDSLNATRAALEEGVIAGGGSTLLRASRSVKLPELTKEEAVGASILLKSCEAPMRQIVQNTGFDPSVILQEVLGKESPFGFNAISEKVEDLMKCGVIDPVKVVKNSLAHAVSMAGVVLLSEAIVIERS